jgi:hypothetical protein
MEGRLIINFTNKHNDEIKTGIIANNILLELWLFKIIITSINLHIYNKEKSFSNIISLVSRSEHVSFGSSILL